MKKFFTTMVFLCTIACILFPACGPSLIDATTSMIEQGRHDEVIARMRRALVNEPGETEYMKLMGIAMYNKKMYRDATKTFQEIIAIDDEDDQAAFYLASSYEELKEFDKAIQYYRIYNELSTLGEYRETVEARIKILYRQQMQADAQRALKMEAQLGVAKVPTNTIAILYFENKGQKRELDPLQKGLAEMIITDLSKVNSLKVVERVRLQKLIEEMNLGETDMVDQKSAPRMGKLLGAYRLIKGSFLDLVGDKVRIDALVARTKTGELDATTNISGTTKDFFRLEKELVFKILEEIKVSITDAEREAILEIPTENFFAFLQYSQGIDFEDKGMYQQAFQSYSQAATVDPNFSQAKTSAASAQKSEQITESSTSSSGTQETPAKNTNQQPSSGNKQSTATAKTASSAPASRPMSVPPPPPPSSGFTGGSNSGISDRLGNMNSVINSTTTPGANSQSQPPATVIQPLPAPVGPPN